MKKFRKFGKDTYPIKEQIAVIVCTEAKDRLEYVKKGLRSLERQTFNYFNVIIIDARKDNLLAKVCNDFSDSLKITRVKTNKRNLAHSRNIGIVNTDAQIVSFMDDDAEADKNWLKEICTDFKRYKDVVGVAGKILSATNSVLSKFSEKLFDYGESIKEINTITGANMSFHIQRIRKLKGYERKKIFNEEFPFAGEETDACFYIRSKGGKLLFDPRVIVKHHFPVSIKTFVKKHVLYGEGDYTVMTKPEYKKFSLIEDYANVFDKNAIAAIHVVSERVWKLTKTTGLTWMPLFLLRELSYCRGLYSSFLKDNLELK